MANNNCLLNAAMIGFVQGALDGRKITSPTATDYLALKNAAVAFAGKVNTAIPFDALITTSGADPTMLVDTASQTIQSNTQMRPALLQAICAGAMSGSYTEDAVAADYTNLANACAAAYTEALLGLTSP